MNKVKVAISGLALSAAAFVGITQREGFTAGAIIPTKGDVPTYGFGSTVREDGTKVQMGDKITPPAAIKLALKHIAGDEVVLRKCLGPDLKLSQGEWDAYVDLSHNIGSYTFCVNKKTGGPAVIPRTLHAGDYIGACKAILQYKFAAGYDCSTPGNQRCAGVWTDRQRIHKLCMESQ